MPELPEVETMAWDLAPLVEGATISEAWWDWTPVIAEPSPQAFATRIVGRRVEHVGRRAKWLVLDLAQDGTWGRMWTPQAAEAARWGYSASGSNGSGIGGNSPSKM